MSMPAPNAATSLTRYRPAVLVLTALAATCSIYYIHNNFWASTPVLSPSLNRRNAQRRRRRHAGQPSSEGGQRITTEHALALYRSVDSRDFGPCPFRLGDRDITVSLSRASRRSAASLAVEFGVAEDECSVVADHIDGTLLFSILVSTLPDGAVLSDPRGLSGFTEAFVQEGFTPSAVRFALRNLNRLHASQGEQGNAETGAVRYRHFNSDFQRPNSPLPDDRENGTAEQPRVELTDRTLDGESLESWSGDDRHDDGKRDGQSLLNLLYHIAEDQARREGYVHRGISCNSCNTQPIKGIRYRCLNCIEYDLCEQCEALQIHPKTHVFCKVRIPVPFTSNTRHQQPPWYPGKPMGLVANLTTAIKKRLSRNSEIEESEIDALWDQFKCLAATEWSEDPYQLGIAIDRATFLKCFTTNTSGRYSRPNLIHDRMFALYDTNSDGLIGFGEFLYGLSRIKQKNPKDKWTKVFQGYDLDSDGLISRKDMLRMFRAFYALSKELTREMIAGIEDDVLEAVGQRDVVAGSQPISSAFAGTIPGGEPSRVGQEKNQDLPGDRPTYERSALSENNEDIGDYHEVVADASERYFFGELGRNRAQSPSVINELQGRPAEAAPRGSEGEVGTDTSPSDSRESFQDRTEQGGSSLRLGDLPPALAEVLSDPVTANHINEVVEHFFPNSLQSMSSDPVRLSEDNLRRVVRKQGVEERWQRRHFYLTEEDRIAAPKTAREQTEPEANDEPTSINHVKSRMNAVKYIRNSSSFRTFRLSIQDEMSRRHWDIGDEAETQSLADLLINIASLNYEPEVMVADLLRLGHFDDASDFVQWFLGYIVETEKEIRNRPADNQTSKSTRRSRSSSKVRFEDDLTDAELESRSNTSVSCFSVSSRRTPVGERWGAYEVPEPEKDLGQEYLYQITQEGLNELLDPMFKGRENLSMEVLRSAEERSILRPYITRWLTSRKRMLVNLEVAELTEMMDKSTDEGAQDIVTHLSIGKVLRLKIEKEHDPRTPYYKQLITLLRNCGMDAGNDVADEDLVGKVKEFMSEENILNKADVVVPDHSARVSSDKSSKSDSIGIIGLSNRPASSPSGLSNEYASSDPPHDASIEAQPKESVPDDFPRAALELQDTVNIFDEADESVELKILNAPLATLLQESGYVVANETPPAADNSDLYNNPFEQEAAPRLPSESPDPTLPQNRPSSVSTPNPSPAAAPSSRPSNPTPTGLSNSNSNSSPFPKSTLASSIRPGISQSNSNRPASPIDYYDQKFQDKLKYLAIIDAVEEQDRRRGGPGRINMDEFLRIMEGPKGEQLQFCGMWIYMATFWGSSI